ncbi:MAG: transglutaminase family protein [Ferruginibacter sp.]
MATYRIKHITRYSYASTVIDCANQIILYPINDEQQLVKKHELIISHHPEIEEFIDYFGNRVGMFSIIKPVNEISIESNIDVETIPSTIIYDDITKTAEEKWNSLAEMRDQFPYMDFLTNQNFDCYENVKETAAKLFSAAATPFENALELSKYVYDNFEYQKGVTSVETKMDEVWKMKAGVCQDFAHILLVMLRMMGISARYVSGYICPVSNELRGEGATHAWVEVAMPFAGWIGLDPTNNCIVNDRHVRLAVGRNFSDCTPVKGTYKGSSEHTLEVSVTIENGHIKTAAEIAAGPIVFSYQSKNPAADNNSYRRFMEIQQQQ